MGRKRERERGDNHEVEGVDQREEVKQPVVAQSSTAAQPAFHLPTPRPPSVQSSAALPQFHLPTPRPPPPPPTNATPPKPQPQPQPSTKPPTQPPPPPAHSTPQQPTNKRKRKHRKRKPTATLPLPVDQSLPLPPVPTGHYHVFVGGLPYVASKEEVKAFFQRDGCYVWEVRLAQYGSGSEWAGESRGFCHVELENEVQVARTLLRNGELWSDGESKLTVQLAKPKHDRQQTINAPKQPTDT